jgi:glucosamine-6-phosphate deaminase
MSSSIDREKLYKYCSIPISELANHPDSRIELKLYKESKDVYITAANMMADEVIENNKNNLPTKWVLPAGPNNQYKHFIERVHKEKISLKNVFIFLMDEVLDFNCRPYPLDHPNFSFEGRMNRIFYDKIDPALNVPQSQRFIPRYNDLDTVDEKIEEMGGLDSVYGGLGFRGLVAMCEAPYSPFFTVTEDDYCNMKTRIWPINVDTTISSAERSWGGLTHILPRLAISIGFKSLLNTKKMIFISTTGSWKRTAVRMLMFHEPTVEYPATLFTDKTDVILLADENTAAAPIKI